MLLAEQLAALRKLKQDELARGLVAWRRDRSSRVARKTAARLLKPPVATEARYVRDVALVMTTVHAGFQKALAPGIRADGERFDAGQVKPFPPEMKDRLFAYVREKVGPAFDRMGNKVGENNRKGLALLGIQPAAVPGLAKDLARAREDNIKLVQHAAGDYADQVQSVLRDPKNFGLRNEELRKLLEERGNVSRSRARLIARDQTLKLNAAITAERQKAAGISKYTWSTSRDERVRPMHAELEGRTFAYDDPPVTNEGGDTNNPGEDFQCRCVAIPVIPELEEPEEEEEPERAPEREPEEEEEPAEPEEEEIPGYPVNPEDIPGYPKLPEDEPLPGDEPEDLGPSPEPEPLGADSFARVRASRDSPLSVADIVGEVLHGGLSKWLETEAHRPNLEVVTSFTHAEGGASVEGYYQPVSFGTGTLKLNAAITGAMQTGRDWGEIWRVTDRGPALRTLSRSTPAAKARVRDNFLHEFGHHLHLGSHARDLAVDDLVQAAWRRIAPSARERQRILAGGGRVKSPAVSLYAMKNAEEYFAESYNAYMTEPVELRRHDPNGYRMVVAVLEKLGIE